MASSVLETTVFDVALCLLELLCLAGVGYLAVAALMVRRFVCQAAPVPHVRPPVTLLKPLCGDEPNLYENLRSFCRQDYPGVQVVFGVRTITDPAVAVVERLRAEFSDCDIELVCDARIHGTNLKISNVINMMAKARHDLLVLSDSDMRVRPDYLDAVVAPLLADGQRPPAGLVTCLYRGRPVGGVWSELGSMFINHGFLGQVLVGTLVGSNEGCFGATMALTRDTLARIGGFEAFCDKLADDYALGAAVRAAGLRVEISPHLVETQVHEPDFETLVGHELRWARTLRSIEPVGYGASLITHPLLPATLLVIADGAAPRAIAIFAAVLTCRIVHNTVTDTALGVPRLAPWLTPVRDLLSVGVLIASFCGTGVTWRKQKFRVDSDGRLTLDGDIRS